MTSNPAYVFKNDPAARYITAEQYFLAEVEDWIERHRHVRGTLWGINTNGVEAEKLIRSGPITPARMNQLFGGTWHGSDSFGLTCDECGLEVGAIVRFGDEPDYERRWQDLCKDCLQKAISLFT